MAGISSVELGLIGCIEMTLTEAAKKLAGNGSNKDWTRECLKALAGLGMDIGYGACPDPANIKGEWLYDLIWYKEEKRSGLNLMTDVVLALESEWSTYFEDIRYDFQKLVQAKSRLKMLISQELTKEEFAMLKQDIECFHGKDESEIYIFAMWVGHKDKDHPFRYKKHRSGKEGAKE